VRYFRFVPETGSYVVRMSVARGGSGRGAGVEVEDDSGTGLVLEGLLGFLVLDSEGSEGWERLYLVVIRVVVGRAFRRRVDWVSHTWAVAK